MSFKRVLPRDLFNEAKLLKCLGQLALHAENDVIDVWIKHHLKEEGFLIDQDPADGALFCTNLKVSTMGGRDLRLHSPYNSREHYPLYYVDMDNDDDPEQEVFNDDGSLTVQFLTYCKRKC